VNWDRQALLEELREFDWSFKTTELSPNLAAYCRHYKLNFDDTGLALQYTAGLVSLAGFSIAVQSWRQPEARGTAILVHGYYDHIGLYASLIDFCLRQQFNVIVFDLPGHGLSSGEQAAISNFQEYDDVFSHLLQLVQAHDSSPLYAFGQSTGGAILINYLLKRQLTAAQSPFDKIVLLAPLVRPTGWQKGQLLHSVVSMFISRVKRKHGDSSSDPDFLNFVRTQDPLQSLYLSVQWVGALRQWVPFIEAQSPLDLPLLIIQGDNDGTVEWKHNLEVLAEKFPKAEVFILPDGRHHLVNESLPQRAIAYGQIADWLNR